MKNRMKKYIYRCRNERVDRGDEREMQKRMTEKWNSTSEGRIGGD